jgi:O-succinylbenzoate synthase
MHFTIDTSSVDETYVIRMLSDSIFEEGTFLMRAFVMACALSRATSSLKPSARSTSTPSCACAPVEIYCESCKLQNKRKNKLEAYMEGICLLRICVYTKGILKKIRDKIPHPHALFPSKIDNI